MIAVRFWMNHVSSCTRCSLCVLCIKHIYTHAEHINCVFATTQLVSISIEKSNSERQLILVVSSNSIEFHSLILFVSCSNDIKIMGKTKETPREFCARIVKEFPDTFRTDKLVLFCNYCECPVTAEKLSHVKQHIATEKHKKKVEVQSGRGSSVRQSLLTEHQQPRPQPKINEFDMDFCKMMLEANIPLKKANHPSVVSFFEKHTKKTIPTEYTLRQKCVLILYDDCITTVFI